MNKWELRLVRKLFSKQISSQIDHFDGLCCARLRSVIWTLFEDPNSSSAARVLVIVSSLFLLSSIIMLILSTIPTFQVGKLHTRYLVHILMSKFEHFLNQFCFALIQFSVVNRQIFQLFIKYSKVFKKKLTDISLAFYK